MPQNPANRAGKEQFVVISQRWKRYMKDVGEIILEEREVHEVVLHHVGVGLVVGSYKTAVV